MNEYNTFDENAIALAAIQAEAPTQEPERQYYFIEKARQYVAAMSKKLGRPLFSHVATFGCQMNAVSEM